MGENELGLRYWTAQRLSRRRLLGGAVAGGAAVAALGLVGCAGDGDGDGNGNGGANGAPTPRGTRVVQDGTQDGPGKPGGTLRIRQADPLPSLNPFGIGIATLAQGLTLGFTVYDHMWYVPTDTGKLELFLATKVEQPDPLTVIATLGDATFHDKPPVNGRKVVAEDVVQSFKRFRSFPPLGYSWLHHVMDDIVAKDEKTVQITQKIPWAWVFTASNAGSPIYSSIVPQETVNDDDFLRKNAIGSGHWMLEGHDNGANLRMRKFPNFRIAGQPRLDGLDFRLILDANAALAAFKAGDIDVVGFANRAEAEDTKNEFGDRISTGSDLSRSFDCLMLKYEPPFLDDRVRRAINLLIDRDEIIQALQLGDGKKSGPLPPAHERYLLPDDELQEYWKHDINEARQLLEAASFPFDEEIEYKHAIGEHTSQLAQVLQNQLAKGGIKTRLIGQDLIAVWLIQTLNQGQFRMTSFTHLPYEDPDLPLRFFFSTEGDRRSFMNYGDPEVDAALLAAASELDEEARVEKTKEAQRVIIKKWSPMLNIYSAISYGGRYSYVKGSITGRGSYGLFNRTTWLDK